MVEDVGRTVGEREDVEDDVDGRLFFACFFWDEGG